ncbi:MAG TPA: hypothetical protein VGF17_18145 [Phytomonospora sp.]
MRDDDERAADLDLVVEGDGGPVDTGEPRPSRRALLLGRLARPWPRPLLVVVTAAVAIAGTALIRTPAPQPESQAAPPPVVTPSEPPMYVFPDEYSVVDDEFLVNGDGTWTAVTPGGDLLVEASGKLGVPDSDPVFFGSELGGGNGKVSEPIPAGDYVLEVSCAARLDDVSMRLSVTGAGLDLSPDIPCDGPRALIELTLTEPTSVTVASVGPNAVYIGYSFRILKSER